MSHQNRPYAVDGDRSRIALIPHAYDIKWARDLTQYLSHYFAQVAPRRHNTYLPSRTLQHQLHARALEKMRSTDTTHYHTAFYVNLLEDYTPDYERVTNVSRAVGFIHGSHFLATEPGRREHMQAYERGVIDTADTVFTATDWFADKLPYDTVTVGLPLFGEFSPPPDTVADDAPILFNHRLTEEKHPTALLDLDDRFQTRLIITGPKFGSPTVERLRETFGDRVNVNTSDQRYHRMLDRATFGISFSEHDTFGYSVLDGIQHGLCYFAPESDATAYAEYLPDELLYPYGDIDALMDKLDYYHDDDAARVEAVRTAQENISQYRADRWFTSVCDAIGAAAPSSPAIDLPTRGDAA